MEPTKELAPAQLFRRCDPQQFDFETTADLEELHDFIGQPRAVAAVQFGIGIRRQGYNIFALGPAGTGKRTFVRSLFEKQAAGDSIPDDWCYVNNFELAHIPHAVRLPAGKGAVFAADMKKLVENLRAALSLAFESEEYQTRQQAVIEEFKERQAHAFEALQQRAQEREIALLRTPAGLVFAPVRKGEVLSMEEIQKLSDEQREHIEKEIEALQSEMEKTVRQMPAWQREAQEKVNKLNREVADFAVGGLIDELRKTYAEFAAVVSYLNAVQQDVVENARDFVAPAEGSADDETPGIVTDLAGESPLLRRYQVNLLVDHSQSTAAPVIYEDNPSYQNLVGRVEHRAQMGALLTDFNLIKAGALHRANGGYLILDARKVLTEPYAWEGLKRALESSQLRVESVNQMFSLISTISLEPEPIPLAVKVALVGDRQLYYLLHELDPDFGELFKVQADFEEQMARSDENQQLYARLIGTLVRRQGLRPFDRSAVARLIEHSARMVADSHKLSTWMRGVSDVLQEADYWAGQADHTAVTAADVQTALDAFIHRSDRVTYRLREEIIRGTILIDSGGAAVGQINGLSVMQLGSFSFGSPTRITAQVRMGKGDVIDIEREVELGGPIHSKGVLILAGYLGARYASETPLSLSASLVFEQSYGGVEGDSASSAELYALLSAISGLPIKQSLAVTGSVNQHGQVQAIGGVNEKIEGFFDVCRERGLSGDQGVLIPASNVKHLMLRHDVVEAVAAGQFHIYPVETIDQGIEILTGQPAGRRVEGAAYTPGSVNARITERLAALAAKRAQFNASTRESAA